MKILLKDLILISFLVSCTSYHTKEKETLPPQQTIAKREDKKPVRNHKALWVLHSPQPVRLLFKQVAGDKKLNILLGKGVNKKVFPPGDWELIGFERKSRIFLASPVSTFLFKMDSRLDTYGGSIIVGCPAIEQTGKFVMKRMKFFNRYLFNSKKSSCEIVIGNDLDYLKSSKIKNLNLAVGF